MKKIIMIVVTMLILFSNNIMAQERVNLGYMYGSSKAHTQIVENTKYSVNVVSPTCFDISLKGDLVINSSISQEFVDEMHEKGIKVTPFLSNHWGSKRAKKVLDNPEKLLSQLVGAIYEYDLDGVNVDMENIPNTYKDKLTNFVKLLREKLSGDKTLSIAVAANPNKLETTWVASYDYENLAKYVDYMVLMAYDEHCQGGAEGPVASCDFVKQSIEVVLEKVSKDKVLLGIPLYGRFWKEGAETGGEAIVIGAVENLIKKYRLVPEYDTNSKTPKLTVTIDGMKNAYVNGRYLEEGKYNIWYENENSIREKLKMVNEYNLLGTALWALDNEKKEFWDFYPAALNETNYENTEEIRVRKKTGAYSKIVIIKILNPELKLPFELEKINLLAKVEAQIERLKNNKIRKITLIENEIGIKLVKDEKITVKTYLKKNEKNKFKRKLG